AREAGLLHEIELLRAQVGSLEELLRRLSQVHESFYLLESTLLESPPADEDAAAYAKQLRRIKDIVRSETPPGASIAVVTKGDERLVGFYGREGMHFPQGEHGIYAGGHPASGLAAMAHLEFLRGQGADFFLLPADSLWWLDRY